MVTQTETAVLRFIRSHKQYNVGERASFDVDFCATAIAGGYAELDDPSVPSALAEALKPAAEDTVTQDTRTHALTVTQVQALLPSISTLPELQQLWEGEKLHPNHDGGRTGVLRLMQARAQELKHALESQVEGTSATS